jgi:WD40 repeat protein
MSQSKSALHIYKVAGGSVRLTSEIVCDDRQSINQLTINSLMTTMALSSTNESLRVFSALSWQEQYAFDHSMPELTVNNTGELINIYRECEANNEGSYYEAMQRPYQIKRVDSKKGITSVALSSDAKFVAAVSACTPHCVWVWDLSDYNLNSVLVQDKDVTDMSWCPRSNNLNISTKESSKLYLWSPKGASICQVP